MDYKIVYFAFISADFGGVEQKIIAQFDALSALGADIHLFLISKFIPGKTLSDEIEKKEGIKILINSSVNLNKPWARRKEKFELINSILLKFNPKDTFVYFRYPLADFLFLRFLKKNKAFRFVTEHQDIEYMSIKGWKKGFEILYGKPVRRLIAGFVGVTTEITNFERSLAGDKSHYLETIGNGIDINRYPLRIPKKDFQPNEIRILFIGSGFRTHGLDRLIKSIDMYYKNRNNNYEIQLKVAGYSNEMDINKDLVKKLKLFSKVSFLGNLESESLNEHFNWAQVGMGSMGLHRIGLSKSSTLKAREYFARGLPFFWSSSDDDFPVNYPYILQLKPEDSPFNISKVISFAERISRDENHPQKMRQYSIEHLNWSVKMKKLITFCDKIIEDLH